MARRPASGGGRVVGGRRGSAGGQTVAGMTAKHFGSHPKVKVQAQTVLVTGAGGFVGRFVCETLTDAGFDIVATDAVLHDNYEHANHVTKPLTISANTDWSAVFDNADLPAIDHVVHLAARVHQMDDNTENAASLYHDTNTDGTLKLAEAAAKAGVERFVFMSTIKVCGEETPPDKGFTEHVDTPPTDLYALSKYRAEQGLKKHCADTQMDYIIIRPPLVYGAGVKANFYALMALVTKAVPLPFGCMTKNRRSFVFVSNLADLIATTLKSPEGVNETFHVSDMDDLSTAALVQAIAKGFDRNCFLWPVPVGLLRWLAKLRRAENKIDRLTGSLVVDTTHVRDVLGWTPPYSVADGMRKTTRWFLQNKANARNKK